MTGKTGVLFVHGIQGSPKQFDFMINRLPEALTVRNILLPGHGGTVREFRESGIDPWLRAVRDAAGEICSVCDRVYFVGHSMGGLLGLLAERERPGSFEGMLLICCPFSVRPTLRYFGNTALAAYPERDGESPCVRAARDANSVSAGSPLEYLTVLHPYLELFRLIRTVKKGAYRPACDVRFFYAERDEIVGKKSAVFACRQYETRPETLPLCGHNFFTPEAEGRLCGALSGLLDRADLKPLG